MCVLKRESSLMLDVLGISWPTRDPSGESLRSELDEKTTTMDQQNGDGGDDDDCRWSKVEVGSLGTEENRQCWKFEDSVKQDHGISPVDGKGED